VRLLSPASFRLLTAPQWTWNGGNGDTEGGFYCGYGLAVTFLPTTGCKDDLFADGSRRIGHGGDAYGLRSGLWVDLKAGTGVAYFATDVRAPDVGFTPLEQALARGQIGGAPVR
jgi:hypothetical protein